MLKLLGCIIIISASLGFAFCIRQDMKNHLCLLYELRKLLTDIFYEEQYSLQPVEHILRYSVRSSDERLNEIMRRIGEGLLRKEAGSGEEIWKAVFREHRKKLGLREDEADIIENVGSACFGKCMEENQKVLSLYLERLNFLIETERTERREKQKVYQTVSIMCGLILIILLI